MKASPTRTVLRTLLASLAIIAATFTVLLASDLLFGPIIPPAVTEGIPAPAAELRAITVRTQDNADFPSRPNLPAKTLKTELDDLLRFADTYGYNAVFFEAVPQCDALYKSKLLPTSAFLTGEQGKRFFFDPLAYLTDAAKPYGIQIYAVMDPYDVGSGSPAAASPAAAHPDWLLPNGFLNPAESGVQKLIGKVAGELSANYDIAGVLLSGVDSPVFDEVEDYAACVAKAAAHAHDALRQKDAQRLGMVVTGSAILEENARDPYTESLQKGALDFLVPASDDSDDTLPEQLAAWQALCAKYASDKQPLTYYPLHTATDETAFTHKIDNSRYFERLAGAGGLVVSNYGTLNTEKRTAAYSLAASFQQKAPAESTDFSYPQTFAVTRPAEAITVRSDWQNYFVTGTSDPAKPLTVNGAEVPRDAATGLWGYLVKLSYGTNTVTFAQGGASKSVTITRPQPQAVTLLDTIVKSSVYPANPEVVLDGQQLKLSCNAPAGGSVTAGVGGLTATLKPVSAAQNGVAVTYQATLDLSSLAVNGQVKKIGPVTYRLNYGGMISTQQSAGEVYTAGVGATPVAKMKTYSVPVNKSPKDDGEYLSILKRGCVDYITENAGGAYYKLAYGGYVLKSAVELPEGATSARNNLSNMVLNRTPKGEKLVLSGTACPAYLGEVTDNTVKITLFNLEGFDKLNTAALQSELCDSISTDLGENGSVLLTFHLKEGVKLLGWDVQFDGNDTILYLKEKPAFHRETATPLSDVTVAIDPGHGGTDPGAAGIPAASGPWEKTLNLADAYALKSRLEALGATVHLLQEDETMTLNDRMEKTAQLDADLFLSCHHNSLAENTESNDVSGIEVYYYDALSKALAEHAGENLSADTGRKLRWVQQSYYRVTMTSLCPAILVESGYLCNPTEYEQIADEYAMYRYGNAIADAALQFFAD